MSLQKLRPFALAFFMLLLCGTFALAQANNPPMTDDQANAAAGTAAAGVGLFGCVCGLLALAVGIAIEVAILMFVYKDAKARGTDPMLWLVLCFFTTWIGLIIWLVVRPPLQEPRV